MHARPPLEITCACTPPSPLIQIYICIICMCVYDINLQTAVLIVQVYSNIHMYVHVIYNIYVVCIVVVYMCSVKMCAT